ncbi:MAG: OmpA family protein [Candidatus Eisenbacteria sp.]|nr:OmpA family protein [Candidatus Eisenbacteria bacterium]
MKKKQQKLPADESFETTYIALMLLLFCFMVILVSMAQMEGPRFRKAIGSVRGALSMLPEVSGTSMISSGGPGVLMAAGSADREKRAEELREALEEMLGDSPEGMVEVEVCESGFALTLGSLVLFERGDARLKPEAVPILGEIGEFLMDWPGAIRVVGHTCNLPIRTAVYPSNWDLSIVRAAEVIRYLEKSGLEGRRMVAVGMGSSGPVVPNDTEENRVFNRRVEILLEY